MKSLKHPFALGAFGAFGACMFALLSTGAYAAGGAVGGSLNSQMVLTAGCSVTVGGTNATSGGNLGTLDFGTQPSTFTGVLVANPSSGSVTGGTSIACSPEISAVSVSVNGGNNPGQGASVGTGSRALKQGNAYLPYEVYSDAAMTSAFPAAATPVGVAMPGNGAAIALPVYGRINKTSGNAMPSGSYVDVLQVTVSW